MLLFLFLACHNDSGKDSEEGPKYATEFRTVQLDPASSPAFLLAVNACQGLDNRKLGGSVYVEMESQDAEWLDSLGLQPSSVLSAEEYLQECVQRIGTCVRYSYSAQQTLLPNILTIASVLGAVPVEEGLSVTCPNVAFDATQKLASKNTPVLATDYVFEEYGKETTGLAMLNPGYDLNAEDLSNPPITRDMSPALVDFVFAKKLFTIFLINGCVSPDAENELLYNIVNKSVWQKPLGVWGYNNSWNVGGFLYEAQTRCLESRNMGAIASETGNLSFFSTRRPSIAKEGMLPLSPPEEISYDPTKIYVAFVVGDGDNVRYIMTTRRSWLQTRLSDCVQTDNSCAPLSWSISPHLPRIAPDVLEWYYASAASTGKDYFVLPPSGHFYAYPSSMGDQDQERFATETEEDGRILGVKGVVHWDWLDTWKDAESVFLPRYANKNADIQGIFPVNVPYLLDAFPWWPENQFYEILSGKDGGKAALFRPREWRGIDETGHDLDLAFYLSPEHMAEEIASYPPGTVTWVYMTSDGGLNLENSFMSLTKILPPNVQLVSTDTAARLAIEANGG